MNVHSSTRLAGGVIAGLTALCAASLLSAAAASAAGTPGVSVSGAPADGRVSIAAEKAHGAHASQPAPTSANSRSSRACPAPAPGHVTCLALKRDGVKSVPASASPDAIPGGHGYGPSQLQSAYNLTAASAANGSGRTIAIVDAYDDPNAASDLATYRAAAGLPPVPSFAKLNQNGQTSPLPAADGQWAVEVSLDLDMASAVCPLCNLVLVEAAGDSSYSLGVAENTAASLAGYISNSWGAPEDSVADPLNDAEFFHHPGVVITAASGDLGYHVDTGYPATLPDVVSVGGTTLTAASNPRGWSESVWDGSGSLCSGFEPQPSWQAALGLTGCSNRIDNDVAAVADPNTGVAIYDTFGGASGWSESGGTSASSPMLAAMFALAGNPGTTPAADIYAGDHAGDFYDITSGSNGPCDPSLPYLCTARAGYDAPTGMGTPHGIYGLVRSESQAAYQSQSGDLSSTGEDGTTSTTLAVRAGTSPSIAAVSGGHEVAYQAANGDLSVSGPAGTGDLGLGMMAGTSPSIAAVGSTYQIAFQANTGDLWTTGSEGTRSTHLGMMAGTSPAITAVAGGYQIAFQANTGALGVNTNGVPSSWVNTGFTMMAGTSPAITAVPGGYQVAFQDSAGYLVTTGADLTVTTWLGMMAGTSPAIAAVPGGYEVAFQANTGALGVNTNGAQGSWVNTGFTMMAGTSPSIAAVPGGYEIAFQSSTGALGLNSDGVPGSWINTGLQLKAGTSPAIAA